MEYILEYGSFLNENKVPSSKDIKAKYIDTGFITNINYNKLLKEVGKKYAPWVISRCFTRALERWRPAGEDPEFSDYDMKTYVDFVKAFVNRKNLFKGKAKDIYNISHNHIFSSKDFDFGLGEDKLSVTNVSSHYGSIGKKSQEKLYKTRSISVNAESNILYEDSTCIAVETNGNNSMAYWTFWHDIKKGNVPPVDNCITNAGKSPHVYDYGGEDGTMLVIILPNEEYFCFRRFLYTLDAGGAICDVESRISPYILNIIFKKYPKLHKAVLDRNNYINKDLYDVVKEMKKKNSYNDFYDEMTYYDELKNRLTPDVEEEIKQWEKTKHKQKFDFFKRSDDGYGHMLNIDYLAFNKKYFEKTN